MMRFIFPLVLAIAACVAVPGHAADPCAHEMSALTAARSATAAACSQAKVPAMDPTCAAAARRTYEASKAHQACVMMGPHK